ncbi:MAG: glycosyl hydrolase [Candidatus Sumerlaeota bacterium]|nr:glycosyl hydrolase [Candidatus Sumerlaeota bacterium]
MLKIKNIFFMLALMGACLIARGQTTTTQNQKSTGPLSWPAVTSAMRPWAYWWWMGSAVNPADLTRELERYRAAGMGGVHAIPIYGAKGYETQYIEYLSPKWMQMLEHAITEAKRLDMGVDMTLGTGWCFGGPNISARDATARVDMKSFNVAAGAKLDQKFDRQALQALVAFSNAGKCVELTDRISDAGAVDWTAEGGAWKVFAVSPKPTGQRVKRAAPGGDGYMLNPFFAEAIQHYLPRFSQAFESAKGPKPRAIYHDSYEYSCDWSPDIFEQFEKRRGYRLQQHLPAFFSDAADDQTARVKCDFRETVSDMMTDNFMSAWVKWSHDHGCLTRNQAHGSPGNLLDLYAASDIPETEMFDKSRNPLVSKFASSAAHVTGKNLVASESGTWLAEHFTETLGELKRLMDILFVSGVNHVIYHGTCYSPDEAGWPGWLFYASTEMNPRNAFWRDAPILNAYIARCQSVLQSGRPGNDILVYWPIHDFWNSPKGRVQQLTVHGTDWLEKQAIGRDALQLWKRGFCFDYISDRQLAAAKATASGVEAPGGDSYKVIVVPPCGQMPLASFEKLLDLAGSGATIIFHDRLPGDVPGLGDLAKRREAFQKALAAIKLADSADAKLKQAKLGRGRILVGDLEAALAQAGVARETMADRDGVVFIRRANDAGHSYFIVNQGAQPLDQWISPAVNAASAVVMEAMNGRSGVGAIRKGPDGKSQVHIQLEPGESLILRTLTASEIEGAAWQYAQPAGAPIEIAGAWDVKFIQGGPELPKPFKAEKLASWTQLGGAEAERFAGTALYSIAFDAPPLPASGQYMLDLGTVCHSARVRLNSRDQGALIMAPYRLVLEPLKPKGNLLEVEVTNLSANRIRDLDRRGVKWKNFNDINFVNINYKPFDASGWPVRDSGLLGPVRIYAAGSKP